MVRWRFYFFFRFYPIFFDFIMVKYFESSISLKKHMLVLSISARAIPDPREKYDTLMQL